MMWYGQIAFSHQTKDETGVVDDHPILKNYYGQVIRNSKRDQLQNINPNLSITNQISVIADPFLETSFHDILYVTFMGSKWRVSSVEVQPNNPRLTINISELYKEDIGETNYDEG